jgi:tetratricopeptide (TPR) repeat protein
VQADPKDLRSLFYLAESLNDLEEYAEAESIFRKLLEADPFAGFRLKPNAKRIVTFLRDRPTTKLKLPLTMGHARILTMKGNEVFTVYYPSPNGPAFMVLLEKTFGKEQTTRTWDTIALVAR